jgi:hypothetical protein
VPETGACARSASRPSAPPTMKDMSGNDEPVEIYVTVKAYPQIGRRTGEAVCVAGIRTDTDTASLARLWPVPFRDLEVDVQFKKYQRITLQAQPSMKDRRPESLRPNCDTIECHETLASSGSGLKLRRTLVESVMCDSMCDLARRQEKDGTSLGAFRPADAVDVDVESVGEWTATKRLQAAQGSLLLPDKRPLQQMPWKFLYRYRCADAACGGHRQSIVDWEIGRFWMRTAGSDEQRVEEVRRRWTDTLCGADRDVVFFVGNMHQHPANFLVLGVFWPKNEVLTPSLF